MGLWITLGIILTLLAAIVFFIANIYNKLVVLKNRYLNAYSQIEIQLKRRHDLIPALVETVKGYMAHERETLEAVITARNQAASMLSAAANKQGNESAMSNLAHSETALTSAVGGLFAVMEAYPDLKADQSMLKLQEELTTTENRIAFSRQSYNDSATAYNSYRQSFPPILIAPSVGHPSDASFLEFEDSAQIQTAPEINI